MKSEPRTSAIALTFHGVRSESGQMVAVGDSAAWRYVVSWKVFDAILERLLPSNCCCCEDFGQKDGDDWRILTFDDGLASDFEVVFPALLRRELRATFFVTAENVGRPGYTSFAQLREMAAAGMEIGSHGLTHRYLINMSCPEALREICESKEQLEQGLGRKVAAFAVVGGHFSRWMPPVVAKAGYRIFATMIPGESALAKGLTILRRNHIQSHHRATYAAQLIAGRKSTLWGNYFRYQLLRLPKLFLGLSNYDRLKKCLLHWQRDSEKQTVNECS